MTTLTLVLLLTLAIPCLTLHGEADTLTLEWDYPADQLIEQFRVWRTAGACPQATRPAQPLVTTLGMVRKVVDSNPLPGFACYTVTAVTAPALPTGPWSFCADEGGVCTFTGTQVVRYGGSGVYVARTSPSPVACTNAVFGDPLVGRNKACVTTPALGAVQESAPSNALQQPATGIMAPTSFRLVPQ
jgi:hypothetical protein